MGFSIDTAQQVLAKFADICVNDNGKWYGDLALYFAECATDFTLGYGDIDEDFYEVLGDAYHEAIVAAGQDEELYKLWKDRRSIYVRNIIRYHGYRRITNEQESTQSTGCS